MKVVFISNFFNHHQKPFADAMYAKLGDEFTFIETGEMAEHRKSLGWELDTYPPYAIPAKVFFFLREKYTVLINDADVVIIGGAPDYLIEERKKLGKLIFRYSERPFKYGLELLKLIPRFIKWHLQNPSGKPIYMLCASAYTASDYAKFGLFKNKCYKWGYFPATKTYDNVSALIDKKTPCTILWVARFIPCKHAEVCIALAKRLKDNGYKFTLNLIGNGPLEEQTKESVRREGLSDCVQFLGTMKPEDVRTHMENSEIFLFTSDREEGWGAVINESMNSACAVVASDAAGAPPFLIKNGENGSLYSYGDMDDLYQKVTALLRDSDKRKTFSENAYKTVTEEWNAENAANKLLALFQSILNEETVLELFESGVCSKAK